MHSGWSTQVKKSLRRKPLLQTLALASLLLFFALTCDNSSLAKGNLINHLKAWSSWCSGEGYELDMDKSAETGNEPAARIKSLEPEKPQNLASLYQSINAESYKGKRAQFTALIKTEKAAEGASLGMIYDRVDETVAGDDMSNRAVKGTQDWKECSIVLNIPESTKRIRLGFMLKGSGTAWMKALRIKTVDNRINTTERPYDPLKFGLNHVALHPRNLGFTDAFQTDDDLKLHNWGV